MTGSLSIVADSYKLVVYDKRKLRSAFGMAGREVAAAAKSLIRTSGGSGRRYPNGGGTRNGFRGAYRKKAYTASAPGQAPVQVTKTLIRSIKVYTYKSGEGVAVRAGAFYSLFLEAGTPRLDPRPFLSVAFATKEASIAARIKAAVDDGIAFKRVK